MCLPEIISLVPTQHEAQFFEDRLYEHNSAITGRNDGKLFSKLIYNPENSIIAGIMGWTWCGACEITALWVAFSHRENRYGTMLLKAAEEEAEKERCKIILIRTYNFQSPGFYRKHGYEVVYSLTDFPPGHNYYFLIKRLKDKR